MKVIWVTQSGFGLADGKKHHHPFGLSEKWTVEQMQIVWDNCLNEQQHDISGNCLKPAPKQTFTLESITEALNKHNWNQMRAAKSLNIPQGKLNYYIKKYKLRCNKWNKYKPKCED